MTLKTLSDETLTALETAQGEDAIAGDFEFPRFTAKLAELGLDEEVETYEVEEEINRRERASLPDTSEMALDFQGWLGRLNIARRKAAMACNYSGSEATEKQARLLARLLADNEVRVASVAFRGDMLTKREASAMIDGLVKKAEA